MQTKIVFAAEKRAQAEKRRGARGEASRKVFEAEVAWPARTMRVPRAVV